MVNSLKEILARSELFEGFGEDKLSQIARISREESYEAGEVIFKEGDPAEKLCVVVEGKVALEMKVQLGATPRRQATIEVVEPGQPCGWSAVIGSHPFTMSGRCIEPSKVISIDGASLRRLLEDDPRLGFELLKRVIEVVSSRLGHTRKTLANILSITSHDLKSPLAAVESYNQVLLSGFAGEISEKQKQILERNSQRIKELLNLIDNILDISRIEAAQLEKEPTSLQEIALDVAETIRPLAEEKGIELKLKIPSTLPQIKGSKVRLQQVFTNLLGNAVKFTPNQGVISLKLEDEDGFIKAEVADTGVGISEKDLPRIFDDFYRGMDTEFKGAGLGLSICKKIIEAHGGRIWAESPCPETGKGSKFTFILPKSK